MRLNKKMRLSLFLQNAAFVLLFLTLAGLLIYLSRDYQQQWDITQNSHNSLSSSSQTLLKQITGPVTITAYATEKDPQLGDIRKIIREFIAPYQRTKPDLTLNFIDPAEQPQVTRNAGVQANGELVVEYKQRSEHLTNLNEQALTNLLVRLARRKDRVVTFLEGHGERKLDGIANHDLGNFGNQLKTKGFKITSLNLAIAQDVPVNTHLLVIASPQVDLLPGETDKILNYLKKGGNLLWLIDQESLHGLQPLAEKLGLELTPGTIVDPAAQQLKAPPTWALGTTYAHHPITQKFNLITVFPFARQIGANENKGWRVTPLIEVAQNGWVEMGRLDNTIAFDKTHDIAGPINIASSFERAVEDKLQRIVVVGSGAFLSNTYLGNGGNLDLGINAINWLAGDDNLITIQPRATIDSSLSLSKLSAGILSVGFLIIIPLALLITGLFIWLRRRKQ
ncbi:ABC-type uncharacterized transport system involved in gliding motility auxiliary subunit [Sulfurirhabdus autotrophica]|uniref:ABC-type uncharacterized transport system involved in gliding motility auxiliary subunit n=2 Tax=Sulfurirhabdus autotrophica TaxID=1706046 RepID=A0A4R3XZY0_9PROT|nr:ABC-type uncharacterized transport system involved in gliding motility auxiliary subunit [Sulfurirhabdus autotrophica]